MFSFSPSPKLRTTIIFFGLIFFACLPIWCVENFVNQDGSAHLYNSYLMLEMLHGNKTFLNTYTLNSTPIPNWTGYWLLIGLLLFFKAATVTKLMVTFTFAGLVAGIGWLRYQTSGFENLNTSLLIGTSLAFNWMWLLGFYNFIIGVIGFTFTLGLFWRWRENLSYKRSIVLSILLIFVYLSHLISFGMLAAAVIFISLFAEASERKKTLLRLSLILLPVFPLIISYKYLSENAGGDITPIWRILTDPFSISNWLLNLQGADPFLLLSHKAFPLTNAESNLFALFSPSLWLAAALICLSIATIKREESGLFLSKNLQFLIIVTASILFWIFSPDDFGVLHGGFLRERVLLCGLICFVPLYDGEYNFLLKRAAQFCLIIVIIFQTASLWDYALQTDEIAGEYLSARQFVNQTDSIGSIAMIENGCRYKSNPLTSLNTLTGLNRETRIWDNYEIAYYIFPVVPQMSNDRQIVFDFIEGNSINLCNPPEVEEKLSKLKKFLDANNNEIKVMLVWNGDQRLKKILSEWYQVEPYYTQNRVSLFRHR